MSAKILTMRQGLRHPRKYVKGWLRQPGKHLRNLFASEREPEPVSGGPNIVPEEIPAYRIEDMKDILAQWPWRKAPKVPDVMPNGAPWPRISIVTPSYNQGVYIEETIRSVLMQGYPNLQYIVVDGASTDETQTILKRYSHEIDVCLSEKDAGQSAAINKGFQYANGSILAWLNSDDRHMPDTLTSVALAFESSKAITKGQPVPTPPDLVCGQAIVSDEIKGKTSLHKCRFKPGIHKLPKDIKYFDDVWQTSPGFFYQPEVFFTRNIWERVGSSLNSLLYYALDYDLWIRMSKHNVYILSLDKPLAQFRVHPKQKTKFDKDTEYSEHQAVSLFHQSNPAPEAAYVPTKLQFSNHETIPQSVFDKLPLSFHKTSIGNYYVPCLAHNDVIANEMKVGRIFEPEIVETARLHIKPGTLVLDVGANFGQMSLMFSDFVGKDGMVFSFEAQEYCHAILLKNITANQKENIRAFQAAVFDHTRSEVTFPEPAFNRFPSYGSFPVNLGDSTAVDPQVPGKVVKTLAIDDLKIDWPISFFKIDVQGSDLFVLRGARETILKHKMPILFEYEEQFQKDFGTKFEEYVEFIHSIGYKIDRLVNQINYLCLPDESLLKEPEIKSDTRHRNDVIEITSPPFRKHLNKFLKNRGEVEECTKFLYFNGYVSHNLKCKDWDMALLIPEIGDGNVLDMGSSDSYILKNICLKKTKGSKYGIDYNNPDVPLRRGYLHER